MGEPYECCKKTTLSQEERTHRSHSFLFLCSFTPVLTCIINEIQEM